MRTVMITNSPTSPASWGLSSCPCASSSCHSSPCPQPSLCRAVGAWVDRSVGRAAEAAAAAAGPTRRHREVTAAHPATARVTDEVIRAGCQAGTHADRALLSFLRRTTEGRSSLHSRMDTEALELLWPTRILSAGWYSSSDFVYLPRHCCRPSVRPLPIRSTAQRVRVYWVPACRWSS